MRSMLSKTVHIGDIDIQTHNLLIKDKMFETRCLDRRHPGRPWLGSVWIPGYCDAVRSRCRVLLEAVPLDLLLGGTKH